MKQFILPFLLILTSFQLFAQFSEDFADGDFTSAPSWIGTDATFIVNANNELQLNDVAAGNSYLTSSHGLTNTDDKEWRFRVKQSFSPSGSNNGRFYLGAASTDLTTNPDGLYLQLGEAGSTDAIRLIRRVGGTNTEILTGTTGDLASSFDISIRLTHSALGDWSLFVDPNAGDNFVFEATANDVINSIEPNIGILCNYTSSNSTKFYFDDIYAGDIIVDNTPPVFTSVAIVSATELDVLFDEPVEITSAQNNSNYLIDNGIGNPSTAILDATNSSLIHLTLSTALAVGSNYQITVENVEDLNSNPNISTTLNFEYLIAETPVKGDVVINEFMCDPSPVVGLPEVEFIEVYNRSTKYFNLNDWKIGDASSFGTVGDDAWLNPGEYVILVANASLVEYPNGVGVSSFPSLNNSGDDIILQDNNGLVIDKISYTNDWYQNDDKANGGYSIERINPTLICSGIYNWKASDDLNGGTPSLQNSVYDASPDLVSPTLINGFALQPNFIQVELNEGADSASIADAVYSFTPALSVNQVFIQEQYPTSFTIEVNEDFVPGDFYEVTIENIADCSGNATNLSFEIILPEAGVGNELIINEILYNPINGGSDFVEVYNNSDKYIELQGWEIANYDDDTIANFKEITVNYLLSPRDYVVLTEDSSAQISTYPFAVAGKFIEMDIPSFSNDSGTVYIILGNEVSDKVSYDDDWQFQLLDDSDGKSLERFSFDSESDNQESWHTASQTVSFATPGRVNSQAVSIDFMGDFYISNETISPDNDGFEDVVIITYEMNSPELVGSLKVYNDRGVEVKSLASNYLLGSKGSFSWDGLNEDNNKASIGSYILLFKANNLETGETLVKRKVVTLTGKL